MMPLKALSFWRFLAVEHLVFDEGKIFREAIFRSLKEKRTVVGKDILGALRVKERQNTTCKRSRSGTNLENAKDSTLGQCFDDLCESVFDLLVDDREVSPLRGRSAPSSWRSRLEKELPTDRFHHREFRQGVDRSNAATPPREANCGISSASLSRKGTASSYSGTSETVHSSSPDFFRKATFGQGRELSDNKLVVMIGNRKFGSKRLHREGATHLRLPAQLEVAINNELTGNLVERRGGKAP